MRLGNRELRIAAIVATGFIGCADGSAPPPDEKVSEVSLDWSVASCDDPPAHQTFWTFIAPPVTSPATYNACTKSFIVNLISYSAVPASGGGPGGPVDAGSGSPPNVTVRWAHALPTTQSECTSSFVGGIFYRYVGSAWQNVGGGQNLSYGVWANGACSFAPVVYEPLELGDKYRVAATARDAANNTVPVTIQTGDPGVP